MKARGKRGLIFAVVCVLAGAVLVAALTRDRRELVTYTSPAVTFGGRTVRLRALVPAGWEHEALISSEIHSDGKVSQPIVVVYLSPTPRFAWLPEWLRRSFAADPEPGASITLWAGITTDYDGEGMHVEQRTGGLSDNITTEVATRNLQTGPGYSIYYSRSNHADFEATYRQVCDSLTVIK